MATLPKGRIILPGLSSWQRKVLLISGVAGGTGIITYAIQKIMEKNLPSAADDLHEPPHIDSPNDQDLTVFSPENTSTVVSDEMSFREAFAAARAASGPGNFFTWKNNLYNTFFKEEFDCLDVDQKAQFYAAVRESIPESHPILPVAQVAEAADIPPEIPLRFEDVQSGHGVQQAADLDGDGYQETLAVDNDLDNYADQVLTDSNGDGLIDRIMRNTNDNPGLDEVLERQKDGTLQVLEIGKNTQVTMDEFRQEAPPTTGLHAEPELLNLKSGTDADLPPEVGAIQEDLVLIDPDDLLPADYTLAVSTIQAELPDLDNQLYPGF